MDTKSEAMDYEIEEILSTRLNSFDFYLDINRAYWHIWYLVKITMDTKSEAMDYEIEEILSTEHAMELDLPTESIESETTSADENVLQQMYVDGQITFSEYSSRLGALFQKLEVGMLVCRYIAEVSIICVPGLYCVWMKGPALLTLKICFPPLL
ncbi:uncharacterized protein LOC103522931 [Diaphorina citri]|uniref:Uncharacterized protein LOC103522931 n=1 Tax=Diaphorina citri TaxID=121845 RepID=A0A1S3DS67_DIACI|nr:uncharacterized protein LOC103522931 [Diaphorina citri]